jgi:putative transposase
MIQRRFQNSRKNLRLENHDYSSAGAYYVTICTQSRATNWFGEITRDGMQLNNAGNMILKTWNELPTRFPIELDTFIIMPDHVHGIIRLNPIQPVGATLVVALPLNDNSVTQSQNDNSVTQSQNDNSVTQPHNQKIVPLTHERTTNDFLDVNVIIPSYRATTRVAPTKNRALGEIVGAFKSLTTNQYIRGVRELGWQPFEKRLWERNFFERVIRDDRELEETRKYILENPLRWLEGDKS